jgi:hypothetical protein
VPCGPFHQPGTAPDETSGDFFGSSVALSADGNTALIGGYGDNNLIGAAWVFTRSGATWAQQGPKLTASDETSHSFFGLGVALSADGNTALIGSPFDNGVAGAAWVFVPLLVGSSQIQPNVDSNPAGTAEAFRYTAASTGSAGKLSVYLDTTSTATKVIIGLYTNTSAGNPACYSPRERLQTRKPGDGTPSRSPPPRSPLIPPTG